jgi:hypothetical protein
MNKSGILIVLAIILLLIYSCGKHENTLVTPKSTSATPNTDTAHPRIYHPVLSSISDSGSGNDYFFNFVARDDTSYLWNFGDNSTSTEARPFHHYKLLGKYTVSLTIDHYVTKSLTLLVGPPPPYTSLLAGTRTFHLLRTQHQFRHGLLDTISYGDALLTINYIDPYTISIGGSKFDYVPLDSIHGSRSYFVNHGTLTSELIENLSFNHDTVDYINFKRVYIHPGGFYDDQTDEYTNP